MNWYQYKGMCRHDVPGLRLPRVSSNKLLSPIWVYENKYQVVSLIPRLTPFSLSQFSHPRVGLSAHSVNGISLGMRLRTNKLVFVPEW